MLSFDKTRIFRSVERKTATGTTITAEGQALVLDVTAGLGTVKPSTGAALEQFMGFSLAQQLTIDVFPFIDTFTVPAAAPLTITLPHTPLAGTIRIVETGASALLADPADYSVVGKVVTFVANAGDTVSIAFRYNPTVLQAKQFQGDILPGGAAALVLDSVGVIEVGDVYTSEYDTLSDFTVNPPRLYLGANGVITTVSGGVELVGARVIEAPVAGYPFLGVRIGQ